jgi:hypothetical protein
VPIQDPTPEEARRLAGGPFGREMQNAILQYARPIYWPKALGRDPILSNGTTFFVDAGRGVFGVTAAHVYDGFVEVADRGVRCQIGSSNILFDLRERLISKGRRVDIATDRITAAEIATTGATILTGAQSTWPPKPPELDRGVLYGGFPGSDRRLLRPGHIEFGTFTALGVASSISERDISSQVERENLVATMGLEVAPEGYDLGGLSGGPMLTVVQSQVVSWRLAGVVYRCSRAIGEIVVAARADFISPDGAVAE